uniref:7TM_GPCR_Srx domain-containing protein n=1 Tax=Steinernema glaseri TaxID=37863 RepID=A0A1I8AG19_9BILA
LITSGTLIAIRVGLADYSKELSITSFTAAATGFSMRLQYSNAVVEVVNAFLLFILHFLNKRRLGRRQRIFNSLAYKAQVGGTKGTEM